MTKDIENANNWNGIRKLNGMNGRFTQENINRNLL